MPFEFIIFDLDDTLYRRDRGLMTQVGQRIHRWLRDRMGLTREEATLLRREYYVRYGTTLGGLIAKHDVDVDDYLRFVHDIPVSDYIDSNPALAEMIDSIPLRRVVYSNATTEYCWRVLGVLGVADLFEQVIGIEEVGFRNKPYRDAYEQALSLFGARGPECIMVEDSARNLLPAKALGMTTVLVDEVGATKLVGVPHQVADYVLRDVLDLGPVVDALLAATGDSGHK